jgi:release factor glutamine methyltransferase
MNEAELLFSEILNCDRMSLYLNKEYILDKDKSVLISSALKRRISAEPIQYILGKTEFMGLEFRVNPDVLIPRPETEILVETAIKYVRRLPGCQASSLNILEVGTGSGCIAISLAKFILNAEVTAVDISAEALMVAAENARLNRVKINFIQSDLFNSCGLQPRTCDLIVSNPPYVRTEEIKHLQPEIGYEPAIALDGGEDGLDFYGRIISGSAPYLKKGGFLIMEIGIGQKGALENIFQRYEGFKIAEFIKDYNGIYRIAVARKVK